ncbi:MAG TPA: hypothetical protein VN228_08895 [Pyrinomonadaceae bacterium]|nr:hypothetical protein [Pyrinomonadaceae bacterium]
MKRAAALCVCLLLSGTAAATAARQRSASRFAAPRCLIPGYPEAVAVSEPGRAGGRLRSCLLLTPGPGRSASEEVEGVQALPAAESCPGLTLLRQRRDGRLDKIVLEVPAHSRLRETSDCCGFDEVRVRRDRDGLRLRLRSRTPSGDCFGGSARTLLEEIFLLKGTRLTLEKDNSRNWQLRTGN